MPAATQQLQLKATYRPTAKIEVFYTGGAARLTRDGKLLACSCSDEVKIVDFATGAVLRSIKPDGEAVTALAISPDCRTLVVATRSLYVRVYDMTTGAQLRNWRAHKAPVADLAIDPSGGYVATASADRSVKVWDISGGFCTHHFQGGHGGVVLRTMFHSTKLQLFSAADDGSVRVWDLARKKCMYDLKAHFSAVTSLALCSDGWLLLTGGRDKVVVAWDLRSGTKVATVPVFEAVEGLVTLPPGAPFPGVPKLAAEMAAQFKESTKFVYFATAGEKGAIKLWRSDTGVCVAEVAPEVAVAGSAACELTDLALLPAVAAASATAGTALGPGLMAATADARLVFLTPQDVGGSRRLVLSRQLVGNQDQVTDLRFVGPPAEPSLLAVATNSETVRLYGISNLSCTTSLVGHRDIVLCLDGGLAASGHPPILASGSKDREVRLWAATSGRCLGVGVGHVGAVNGIALSRKSPRFLVSVGSDKLVKVWDIAPAMALLTDSDTNGRAAVQDGGNSAKKRKTEEAAATLEAAATAGPLQLRTIAAVAGHDKDINAVAVAPNDQWVATASQDRTARVWSLPDLVQVSVLRGHKRGVWAVEFAPLERALLTASGDQTVKIWSLSDCSCIRTLEGHTASVLRASFLTGGTQILSTGADGLLKLWNVASGECVNTFDEHEDKIWALATGGSQEGVLATGGGDALVCLWADSTEADAAAAAAAEDELAEREQDLQNALADADFVKAARLAFSLKHPGRLLSIITRAATATANLAAEAVTPMVDSRANSAAAAAAGPLGQLLSGLVAAMSDEDLRASLEYVRDWNTNSKHCHAAQALLGAVLRAHGTEKLMKVPGLTELLSQVMAYSGRHFARLDRLVRSTYLLDFTLESMGVLGVGSVAGVGSSGVIREEDGEEGVCRMQDDDEEGTLIARLAGAASASVSRRKDVLRTEKEDEEMRDGSGGGGEGADGDGGDGGDRGRGLEEVRLGTELDKATRMDVDVAGESEDEEPSPQPQSGVRPGRTATPGAAGVKPSGPSGDDLDDDFGLLGDEEDEESDSDGEEVGEEESDDDGDEEEVAAGESESDEGDGEEEEEEKEDKKQEEEEEEEEEEERGASGGAEAGVATRQDAQVGLSPGNGRLRANGEAPAGDEGRHDVSDDDQDADEDEHDDVDKDQDLIREEEKEEMARARTG
ncbi:hypothetical protein Vafri_20438, partial [Volvox africanus]